MTIVLLFWFLIPWQPDNQTFGYFELELKSYDECLEVRDYLIADVETRYPRGSMVKGACYPKGTFHGNAIDWKAFEDGLRMDLEAGRKAFEKKYGGDY